MWVTMPKKKRSQEEFETFLKAMFAKDTLQVKYQNPDSWRVNPKKRDNAR
jgi:hypothetical protein